MASRAPAANLGRNATTRLETRDPRRSSTKTPTTAQPPRAPINLTTPQPSIKLSSLILHIRRPLIMSLKRKASALPANDAKKPKSNGSITSFFGAPKAASTAAKTNGNGNSSQPSSSPAASTWNKEAWVKKLSEEQRQLLALEIGTMHESWLKELRDEITSERFLKLKQFLKTEAQSGNKIFPPSEDVYAWFVSFHTSMLITPHAPR